MSVLLAILAFLILFFNYRRSQLSPLWKAVAILFKLSAFALLILTLLEPVWIDEYPRNGANDLVLVADNSRGLAINDQGAKLQETLRHDESDSPPNWLLDLDELFRLQRYQVDRRLQRVDDFSGLDFTGNASSLLTSLRSLKTRYAKRPLAAMVIMTDGNATDRASVDAVLEALEAEDNRIPVFPVVVGREMENIRDLAIRDVSVSQSAFEDAPLAMMVDATARGFFEGGVEVFVTDDEGEEVLVEPIIFAGSDEVRTGTARIKIAGVTPGISFYEVGIRGLSDPDQDETPVAEVTEENNRRLVSVDRGRGPYRVLYVSGRPNWEYKFLQRALGEDAEIELVALIRIAKREPKFEWRGRTGESGNPLFRGFGKDLPEETQSYDEPVLIRMNTRDDSELRDGFPREAESLFDSYRAIVFDDVESDFLSAEQQNLVEKFVAQRGGTVVMLGGKESFKGGDWDNTPLARMLPVYVNRLERGGPSRYATFNLSREGWLEPWMRLRGNQDEETIRLAHMPEFFSVNRIPAIKPGASLLATVTDSERRRLPAVVVQRFGEGSTAAVPVGDLWRWGMKDESLQQDLAKMWRQLIRWSVAEVPGRVTRELTRVSDGTLPSIEILTRVRNRQFLPQDDATVKHELIIPGVEEPVSLSGDPSLEEAGVFTASSFLENAGGYRLKTTARDGEGKLIDEVESGWTFNPAADELRSLEPDRELLDSIARRTGGEVIELEEINGLVDRLKSLNVPVMDTSQRPLWHTPWIFLLALLFMIGEWAIRRWKGATL